MQFDVCNLISRQTLEDPYWMACKFRAGAPIKRIRDTTVRRSKRSHKNTDDVKSSDDATTLSDDSNDWENIYDDTEGRFRLIIMNVS